MTGFTVLYAVLYTVLCTVVPIQSNSDSLDNKSCERRSFRTEHTRLGFARVKLDEVLETPIGDLIESLFELNDKMSQDVVRSFQVANNDGGKAYRVPLNDGTAIPVLGLGTFLGFGQNGQLKPKEGEVSQAVQWGIESGYRLIDTAPLYIDEDQVGQGIDNSIKAGNVKRDDIYIVTKLPPTHHGRGNVLTALRKSLKDLNLKYVDLYLIHWPVGVTSDNKDDGTDILDTWKGMEDVKKLGLAKSIGLSNFNISQINRVLRNSEIKQVNLNLQQGPLIDFCKSNGIAVMAYTPFGSLFDSRTGDGAPPPPRKDDQALLKIAGKYGKTTPQIVLRYLIQHGVLPIPKSVKKERIEQNIEVFDFKLTKEEMQILGGFNKDYRLVNPSYWQHHPEYPFEKVDKPIENPF